MQQICLQQHLVGGTSERRPLTLGPHYPLRTPLGPPTMKPKSSGKKGKKGSASGASPGGTKTGEKRQRDASAAASGNDGPMSVPSFGNDGKGSMGKSGPASRTYDWQGEQSVRETKREEKGKGIAKKKSKATPSSEAKSNSIKKKEKSTEPVINRKKPQRPQKKQKVDMRFGSEADKKKLEDERFDERREAKRQKYAALNAAAVEADGDVNDENISGKVLGRRRRAAEKRARAAEKRKDARLDKGLPVDMPAKVLPAKLLVGTAAGVSALVKTDNEKEAGEGRSGKNAKRKERREKAQLAKEAEDAKAGVTEKTDNKQKNVNGKVTVKSPSEESAKAKAKREKREAAEALERQAAALRAAAAESESDSEGASEESEESDEESESGDPMSGDDMQAGAGDWGEQFSSDVDDDEISVDSDEDAALDAAFAESDEEDEEMDEDEMESDREMQDSEMEDSESNSEDDLREVGEEDDDDSEDSEDDAPPVNPEFKASKPNKKLSLVDKMRAKLSGGQFRMLNEALYTTTGDKALAMVENEPGMFSAYHAGFREQTKEWPVRPVDACLKWLKTQPKTLAVADFGCGDAELARRAPQKTVHSFDLESEAEGVLACNMANVPLGDNSVEIAVFSLSLMGTDYGKFMEEAHRVRWNFFVFFLSFRQIPPRARFSLRALVCQ